MGNNYYDTLTQDEQDHLDGKDERPDEPSSVDEKVEPASLDHTPSSSVSDKNVRSSYSSHISSTDCFIATAVYGDINAPEVEILREFRDKVLHETGIGRLAIKLYYSGAGEKTADFVKDHASFLIPPIRRGLDYLVQHYKRD